VPALLIAFVEKVIVPLPALLLIVRLLLPVTPPLKVVDILLPVLPIVSVPDVPVASTMPLANVNPVVPIKRLAAALPDVFPKVMLPVPNALAEVVPINVPALILVPPLKATFEPLNVSVPLPCFVSKPEPINVPLMLLVPLVSMVKPKPPFVKFCVVIFAPVNVVVAARINGLP